MMHRLREIPCIVGLNAHAVSVFEKNDAVCGFLAYFCVALRFLDPPYASLITFLKETTSVLL